MRNVIAIASVRIPARQEAVAPKKPGIVDLVEFLEFHA
jgi:hypothetical protein